MKKLWMLFGFSRGSLSKLVLKMKLLAFLMFAVLAVSAADSYSQAAKFSLKLKDATVREVFDHIEDNSEFILLYNEKWVDVNRRVDINVKNETVEKVLDQTFKGTRNVYKIYDRQVVILQDEKAEIPANVQRQIAESQIQQPQQKEITGTVTDTDGLPLPGVSVIVKGTTIGTVTNNDGAFSLEIPLNAETLQFSFVGMKTQEIVVGNKTTINVTMQTDAIGIEEVVAVGYGSMKKSNVTGSISTVDIDALGTQTPVTVGEMLQGSTTGVQVTNSGDPGSVPIIRIRGVSSLVNNNPLFVVDGIPVGDSRDFNPNDIETIQVLKDASAASIYGSRAANGVILITTKKGNYGEKLRVEFQSSYGISKASKLLDLADAKEFAKWDNLSMDNVGLPHVASSDAVLDGSYDVDTDWQKEVFKEAVTKDANLSVFGGSESISFRMSIGRKDEDGIVIGPKFERTTFTFSGEFKNEYLTIGQNTRVAWSESQNFNTEESGTRSTLTDVVWALPTIPVYDDNNLGGFGFGNDVNPTYMMNPVAIKEKNTTTTETFKVLTNIFSEIQIIPSLKYRLNVGIPFTDVKSRGRVKRIRIKWDEAEESLLSNYAEYYDKISELVVNQFFTFDKAFGHHNINTTIGMSYEQNNYSNSFASGSNVMQNPATDEYYWTLGNIADNFTIGGNYTGNKLLSYFSRLNYSFNDKYLLSAVARLDRSSKFAPDNRAAFFPSISAGWNVHKEDFVPFNSLSKLKIFGGYGELGGNEVGNHDYLGYINTRRSVILGADERELIAATQTLLSTPGLKWQTVATTNVGIELGLLKNKLEMILEYYKSETRDALLYPDIPYSAGGESGLYDYARPPSNIGSFKNTGIETTLNFRKMEGEFNYQVSANISTLHNEVISLGKTNRLASGNTDTRPGYAVGTFYLMEHGGIFQNWEEINAHVNADGDLLQPTAEPGDVRWLDVNGIDPETGDFTGKPDGVINGDDRVMMGNPFPTLDAGLNFSAFYKGLDVRVFFFGQFGQNIYNTLRANLEWSSSRGNYLAGHQPWTGEGTSNTIPKPEYGQGQENFRESDLWLEDGDYVKLKILELGYTLPKNLTRKISQDLVFRIYAQGQNLFTLTKYTGYDPEITNYSILNRGVDFGSYPNPRNVTIGFQVNF